MSGIATIAVIVLLGLLSGAAYYHYERPRAEARLRAELAAAPSTAEARLRRWFEIGSAQIHHRLTRVARFSAEHPWIVTHAIDDGEEGGLLVWGVDVSELSPSISRIEGMAVIVELPAPRLLGRVRLTGERARYVPIYSSADPPPEATERLRSLARWFLEGLPSALEKDIEGASLEIRIRSA